MGMAASQARLLSITARIHDVEYQAQQIQSRKLQLATLEDEAYQKYNDALDATTLTFRDDNGELIPATFNNLCGLSSIDNGMTQNYIFRTSDTDQLIIPDDIYEGYQKFDGDDPYTFAMYMMGINSEDLQEAENEYFSEEGYDENDSYKGPMREVAKQYARVCGYDDESAEEFAYQVLDTDWKTNFESIMPQRDSSSYFEAMKLFNEFKVKKQEYRNKMYNKNCGSEKIYNKATDTTGNFESSKFQYYLRWGMLIEQEGGADYCVQQSEYGADFGNDKEMLNGMLQSGRMIVDTVEIDKTTGEIKDSATSVASERRLDYTPTSTIDKRALAKAEAEYEHTMRELDRKDKRYDMDLNKLETERTALTTEYDSVKKVIQDNIDRTFKIFS